LIFSAYSQLILQDQLIMNVTKNEIIDGFKKLGIGTGDSVTIHSSLKSLGHVDDGAHTVIQALLDVIESQGTILMPAFSFSLKNAEQPVFDVSETPSCVGTITEVFRKEHSSHRSIHLTHSYSALGPLAEELTSHKLDITPCGQDSPLAKFMRHNGKILLVGVGYNSCTAFHVVEEMMYVPYMNFYVNENARYKMDGKLFPLPSRLVKGFKYDFNIIAADFLAEDVVQEEKIGNATVKAFSSDRFMAYVEKRLREDINYFFKGYCS